MKLSKNEQKELFIALGKNIKEAGNYYAKMLSLNDAEGMYKNILHLEREGDSLQAKLDAHFSTQKNAPYLTLERAKLLRRMDDVLDNFAIAARNMHTFIDGLPSDFVNNVPRVSEQISSISSEFADAIENLYTDFNQALKNTTRIEESRDRLVDEVFKLETDYFRKLEGESVWKQFTAVERVIKRTIAVAQKIKDAGEIIELMVYKYSSE